MQFNEEGQFWHFGLRLALTGMQLRLATPPERLHVPTVEVHELNVTPLGWVSLKATLLASYGPLFIRLMAVSYTHLTLPTICSV